MFSKILQENRFNNNPKKFINAYIISIILY